MNHYRMEPLDVEGALHDRDAFTCGEETLDRYIKTLAAQDMRRGFAHVIVAVRPDTPAVLGYYTLSTASVDLTSLPEELRKKMPRYGQVPAVLLGRLAVDTSEQRRGLGTKLLANAVKRALRSELAWAMFLVRAKHEQAVNFYQRFGFIPSANDPLLLWLPRRLAESV